MLALTLALSVAGSRLLCRTAQHGCAQNRIEATLVTLALPLEPIDHISIHANCQRWSPFSDCDERRCFTLNDDLKVLGFCTLHQLEPDALIKACQLPVLAHCQRQQVGIGDLPVS